MRHTVSHASVALPPPSFASINIGGSTPAARRASAQGRGGSLRPAASPFTTKHSCAAVSQHDSCVHAPSVALTPPC
eukprot:scaffold129498_cov63-Phaeocystis_antarctica.AAC.3